MSSIFLCHASEDKPEVEPIQLALSNAGYKVFYDENSLPPGGDYQDRIHKAILQCDIFLFVISRASISQGKYTLTELKFAREKWPSPVNRVLPVNLEAIPAREVPPYLAATTILSISGNAAAEVRVAVAALLNEQRRKKRRPIFAASMVLGLIVLGGSIASFIPPDPSPPTTHSEPFPMSGTILLQSDSGDFIGDGQDYKFSNQNGKLTATATPESVSIYFEGDDHWSLDFAAPEGEQLAVGAYAEAQRAAFHNPVKPGLDISGAGRGCNESTGRFTIQTIEFSNPDTLKRFVANFEQHCEGEQPALHGTLDLVATAK